METYILKIGGGSITGKDLNERKVKEDVIRRIAQEIKQAKQKNDFKLVVVHGAGPFGHKLVTDYGIKNGIDVENGIEGFVRTHNSMEDLNKIIMDIFREEGLLGFPIQPSACIIQNNRKIEKFDIEIISKLLETGNDIIPILYGDMVIDRKLRASVISGDALVPHLAMKLGATRVFFGTDVDGIFTTDPKIDSTAKLITDITRENFNEVFQSTKSATTTDVTGGMKGKFKTLMNELTNTPVIIFNLTKNDNVKDVLIGNSINATKIET